MKVGDEAWGVFLGSANSFTVDKIRGDGWCEGVYRCMVRTVPAPYPYPEWSEFTCEVLAPMRSVFASKEEAEASTQQNL